jgi:Transcriptional regulators
MKDNTVDKRAIYEELVKDIINLKYKPGEYLKEAELGLRFGISRTPLREITQQLAREHYIKVIPRHGNKVSPIDLQYVRQMLEMRIVLENAVLKALAFGIDIDFSEIHRNLEEQKNGGLERRRRGLLGARQPFSREAFQACGKGNLVGNIEKIRAAPYEIQKARYDR